MTGEYAAGGAFTSLSQVGIEFTRQGTLELNAATFANVADRAGDLATLFAGTTGTPGAFASLDSLLDTYVDFRCRNPRPLFQPHPFRSLSAR